MRSRKGLGGALTLCLFGGALALAGCGETSFFDVTVKVRMGVTGVTSGELDQIEACEVTVSGAASDGPFSLSNCQNPSVDPATYEVGLFQFGTDSDSGSCRFDIVVYVANRRQGGMGSATGTIKSGGRQPVDLIVDPDPAMFMR